MCVTRSPGVDQRECLEEVLVAWAEVYVGRRGLRRLSIQVESALDLFLGTAGDRTKIGA